MKHIMMIGALVLALFAGAGSVPAQASEADPLGANDSEMITLEEAPDGYWTPQRQMEAVSNDLLEPITGDPAGNSAQSRNIFGPTPFPVEPQVRIEWPNWIMPPPAPIMHSGIEHRRAVGKLLTTWTFPDGATEAHSCTGTVITSQSESLILTAGHCIWPRPDVSVTSASFVPAYHVNDAGVQNPLGIWNVKATIAKNCWTNNKESRCDQAFLKVAPRASDGATMESITGSQGFTIGGPPERGKTVAVPNRNHLFMHGYPVPLRSEDREHEDYPDEIPDRNRVYKCTDSPTAADQDKIFLGAIQIVCNNPITGAQIPIIGGASGSALIETTPGGESAIATLVAHIPGDPEIYFKLNDSATKELWLELDAYVLN